MNLGKSWQKGVSSARSRFRAKACPTLDRRADSGPRQEGASSAQVHRFYSIETIVRWRSSRLKISTIV
jgi:hypothetical protein